MIPLPQVSKPVISSRQKAAALTIAGLADLLQIVFFPFFSPGILSPLEDALDMIVATLLIAICGFRWQFALAFFMETIPGLSLVPTWTAVVLMLATHDSAQRQVVVSPSRPNGSSTAYPPIEVTAVPVPPVQAPPVQAER